MNRRSVRFRLAAWYAAILAVTLAAVGIGVWLAIRDSINDTVDKDLRSRLEAMRGFLQRQASDEDSGPATDELAENAALAPAGTLFRIADTGGRWLYESPETKSWDASPPDPAHLPGGGETLTTVRSGQPIRVLSAPIPHGVVQIGIPINEFTEMLDEFTWTALVASPLVLLLASAGGFWMSRRALAPVAQIAQTADEIEARNLSERLPVRGTGDELDHLSATLNAMFERLEDSFRRITQFTADASHELRTPIAIIRTTAEVIRNKPRSEKEYVEALDRILVESQRTTELIEDLMLLARADAGAEALVRGPVALTELARSACAAARVLAEASGVILTVEELSNCTVVGDGRAIRRLLLVLLDNAIKYSRPEGRVLLRVTLGEQGGAVIEVRDNGVGISAEDLPHVFERFYRASKDRSRQTGGVGLGLSIAQWIAQRHGGEIRVESKLGEGSLFRVWLPTA